MACDAADGRHGPQRRGRWGMVRWNGKEYCGKQSVKRGPVPVCAWGKECSYALSGKCRFRHTAEMEAHFEKKRELVREEQRWRLDHGCVHCKLGRCRYGEVCRWKLRSDSDYSSGEEQGSESGSGGQGSVQQEGRDWQRAGYGRPAPRREWRPKPRERPVEMVWVGGDREGSETSYETLGSVERVALEGAGMGKGAGEMVAEQMEDGVWGEVIDWWEEGWDGVQLEVGKAGGGAAGASVQGDCAAGISQQARKGRRRRARKVHKGVRRGGTGFTSGKAEVGVLGEAAGHWVRLDVLFWARVRLWRWRLQVLWRRYMYRGMVEEVWGSRAKEQGRSEWREKQSS